MDMFGRCCKDYNCVVDSILLCYSPCLLCLGNIWTSARAIHMHGSCVPIAYGVGRIHVYPEEMGHVSLWKRGQLRRTWEHLVWPQVGWLLIGWQWRQWLAAAGSDAVIGWWKFPRFRNPAAAGQQSGFGSAVYVFASWRKDVDYFLCWVLRLLCLFVWVSWSSHPQVYVIFFIA